MLILCDICDCEITGTYEIHKCDPVIAKAYVTRLKEEARLAESKIHYIQNAVMMMIKKLSIESLPEDGDVSVNSKWLRQIWDAAECRWYNIVTADHFISHNLAHSRLLCEAYDVFRSNKSESLLQKIKNLHVAVMDSKEVLGFQDSKLDLTPEMVLGTQM